MIARIRKSMQEKDQGFTLIELLVVMIIIGILAAIAIPVFTSQRNKAVDTAARADVSTLGKEIATWYVDNPGAQPAITRVGDNYSFAGPPVTNLGRSSLEEAPTIAQTGATRDNWCVSLTYEGGTRTVVSYSAANGLQNAIC